MANEHLSLQEKMVQLRSQIPALVKQAYSEEVNYDFVKIDDIFRYLTPAMNKFKVNFDVVSETATKKDERGNPMYVEYIPLYQTWIYEADLALRWTNAENPEEKLEVTAHAIGCHQMPEKAKGSGWTYCLKYYLLNKFCINQGGDDPDMHKLLPVSEEDGAFEGFYEDEWEPAPEGYAEEDGMGTAAVFEEEPQNTDFPETAAKAPAYSQIGPENGRMVTLPESAMEEPAVQAPSDETGGGMTVEEACAIVCDFGLYRGQSLGDLAGRGAEGVDALEWFVNGYRGRNEKLREGARVLLEAAKAA